MEDTKYIGMDVHKDSISIAVLNSSGKLVMECVIETKAITILEFVHGLRGSLHLTFEEGTWAAWLYDLLKPHVAKLVVCDPRRNGYLKQDSKKHRVSTLLSQIPSIGPIRAALLIALLQTPDRFRTKRQLWAYSGLAIETHDSAENQYVNGQLQRSKKKQSIRGLNSNHNHDLKNIFKGASAVAAVKSGPFQRFYAAQIWSARSFVPVGLLV